jgi:hypothetical protein
MANMAWTQSSMRSHLISALPINEQKRRRFIK